MVKGKCNGNYLRRVARHSRRDDLRWTKCEPNWTVTEFFKELETVSSCSAVISYLKTDLVYINDAQNNLLAPYYVNREASLSVLNFAN